MAGRGPKSVDRNYNFCPKILQFKLVLTPPEVPSGVLAPSSPYRIGPELILILAICFSGIGSGKATLEQCLELARKPILIKQWKSVKHLIIDEVSMVDGDFFEVIYLLIEEDIKMY